MLNHGRFRPRKFGASYTVATEIVHIRIIIILRINSSSYLHNYVTEFGKTHWLEEKMIVRYGHF